MHNQTITVFDGHSGSVENDKACAVCNDLDFNRSQRQLDEFTLSDFEDQECHCCDLIVRAIDAVFPRRAAEGRDIFLEVTGCIEDAIQVILYPTAKHDANQGDDRAYTESLFVHTPRGTWQPPA
jgi:hypothetical protein